MIKTDLAEASLGIFHLKKAMIPESFRIGMEEALRGETLEMI